MNSSRMMAGVKDLEAALRLYRIWVYQGYHSVASKYRRSLLGPFWIAGSMVATALSLAIVFGGIFGQPLSEFLPYITSGLLVWAVVAMPMTEGTEIFIGSAHIIKNHAYPLSYYAFEMIARNFITFLHNLVVFVVMTLCVHALKPIHWTFLPGMVLTYLIVVFYSTLAGMLGARFRDIRFIFPYLAQLLFFLTPIFWKADLIQGPRRLIAELNPLYHVVQLMRRPLLGQPPTVENWVNSGVVLLVGVVLWLIFFTINRRRIAFWI